MRRDRRRDCVRSRSDGGLRRPPCRPACRRPGRRAPMRLESRRRARPLALAVRRGAGCTRGRIAQVAGRTSGMRRIWLRATALALAAAGVVAGLTVYFSTQTVPRCLASGVADWRPPKEGVRTRYEVVVLKDDSCFYDMDRKQKLVGALPLERASWLLAHVPPPSDTLQVTDQQHRVVYETKRGLFGLRVLALQTRRQLYIVHYEG